MNKVNILENNKERHFEYLQRELFNGGHTAFLGRYGGESPQELFLITNGSVVLAKNPTIVWTAGSFIIDRFVDIEINII